MRPKSYGGSWRLPDPLPDLHPVEVGLLSCAGFSLLSVVCCVVLWLFQAGSDSTDYEVVGRISDVMIWSLIVFMGSTGLYLVWNRFVRHG
jgi:hypothetical protein